MKAIDFRIVEPLGEHPDECPKMDAKTVGYNLYDLWNKGYHLSQSLEEFFKAAALAERHTDISSILEEDYPFDDNLEITIDKISYWLGASGRKVYEAWAKTKQE